MRVFRFWHFLLLVAVSLASVLTAQTFTKAADTPPYYYTQKMGCGSDRFCHFDVVEGTMTGTTTYGSERLAVIQVDQLGTWDFDGQSILQGGWLPAGFWKTAETHMSPPQPVMHPHTGTFKMSFGIGTPPYAGGPLKAFIGQHVRLIGTHVQFLDPPPFWGFAYYIAGHPLQPIGVTLTANPVNIIQGDHSTLTWTSTGNPDRLELSTVAPSSSVLLPNAAMPSGTLDVNPDVTTTYRITAYKGTQAVASADATVNVSASSCKKLDFMMDLDRSYSMTVNNDTKSGASRLAVMVKAANGLTNDIGASAGTAQSTLVGLASYGSKPRLDVSLTTNLDSVRSALRTIGNEGTGVPHGTDIAGGIRLGRNDLFSVSSGTDAKKVMLLLTDGAAYVSGGTAQDQQKAQQDEINEANLLKQAGGELFVIGVGHESDMYGSIPLLRDTIASANTAQAPQHFWFDPNSASLDSIFSQIYQYSCAPSGQMNISLTANPPVITEGESSTLSWTSQSADKLTLDNGIGDVAVPAGNKSVSPSFSTMYALIGTRNSPSQQQRVSATVVVKKSLQFCVVGSDANVPVSNATISIDPSLLRNISTFGDHLVTGGDGCTNPDFINYDNQQLLPGAVYPTTITDGAHYLSKSTTWTRTAGFQKVVFTLDPGTSPKLQFRVRDFLTRAPVANVHVLPNQSDPTLYNHDLFTGPDGMTNPGYINYPNLQSGVKYTAEASLVGYQVKTQTWQWAPVNNQQIVDILISKIPPTVTLKANPPLIGRGQSSTLTWDSTNATSLKIDHGVGTVAVPNGSQSVSPVQTTVYTITATGPGGTATATAQVAVTNKPFLQFCVETTTSDGITQAVPGAHVSPDTSKNLLTQPTNLWLPIDKTGFNATPAYLIAGRDGCTNPSFIDYSKVTMNTTYHYLAAADGYADVSANWTRNAPVQIVFINLPPTGALGNVQKSSVVLTGDNQTSPVTISFDVTANTVDNVQLHEVLANTPTMSFGDTVGVLTWPDGSAAQRFSLANNASGSGKWDVNFGSLPIGTHYTFAFTIKYTGAKGTSSAIDAHDDNAACDAGAFAHITYSLNGQPGCAKIPPGQLDKRAPRLILNSDTWIGNQPITFDGTSFQAGDHTLIISGQTVTGQNNIVPVQNYKFPGTGLAAWSTISSTMNQRRDRAIGTGRAHSSACLSSTPNDLWLNNPSSLTDPPSSGKAQDGQVWVFPESGCDLNWQSVHFHGHGTIINNSKDGKGVSLTLHGDITPYDQPNDIPSTLGYISNGPITLFDQASLTNVAMFTTNSITIGPVANPQTTEGTPNDAVQPKTDQAKFIANQIQFPDRNKLRSDITLEKSLAVEATPPPLFEQFILPQGNEVP